MRLDGFSQRFAALRRALAIGDIAFAEGDESRVQKEIDERIDISALFFADDLPEDIRIETRKFVCDRGSSTHGECG